MNKIRQYLNQPFPTDNQRWKIVLTATAIVVFILGVFEPFGLNLRAAKIPILCGFGFVTAISTSIVCYVLPAIFKRFYNDNWTVWKNILNCLLILFIIGLGNTLFDLIYANRELSTIPSLFVNYTVATILVGIVPCVIITVIAQNSSLKQNLKQAKEINQILSSRINTSKEFLGSDKITLCGNTKDSISLYQEELIYLEASGNYIQVNYFRDNAIKHKLLRVTINQIEEYLVGYPQFVRCHRAFIINTSAVVSADGNSQGYKLNLHHTADEIPVSRSYAKMLKEHLATKNS